jgi:transcriptional repressor NrdR
MRCPYCKQDNDKVVDSRSSNDGLVIRRRRECEKCHRRFTTFEKIEEVPLFIIKKDERREAYDRNKSLSGIIKACEKRPVSAAQQEAIVDELEKTLDDKYEKEVHSAVIGEFIMQKLFDIDEVAYVRFASVYRQFKDINHFMKELKSILGKP